MKSGILKALSRTTKAHKGSNETLPPCENTHKGTRAQSRPNARAPFRIPKTTPPGRAKALAAGFSSLRVRCFEYSGNSAVGLCKALQRVLHMKMIKLYHRQLKRHTGQNRGIVGNRAEKTPDGFRGFRYRCQKWRRGGSFWSVQCFTRAASSSSVI